MRPYQRPDTREWGAGAECTAIAPSDGRWYSGVLVAVKAAAATVRFQGEAEAVDVELDAVRVASTQGQAAQAAPAEGEEAKGGASLPKQMEIRPDDSEEVQSPSASLIP